MLGNKLQLFQKLVVNPLDKIFRLKVLHRLDFILQTFEIFCSIINNTVANHKAPIRHGFVV